MSTTTTSVMDAADPSIEHAELQHRPGCVKGCIIGQDEITGHIILVPLCCKNWNCPACAVRLRDRWAGVALRGEPTRFITLTGDPALHPDPRQMRIAIKNAWQKFVAHWRRGNVRTDDKHTIPPHELEYIQVWELHKSGYPHLHILVRGPYIPQPYLKAWMQRAGVGSIVHVEKIDDSRSAVKEVLKYVTKAAGAGSPVFDGARIITTSRSYVPGALPAADDNNTPGYQWVRVNISAERVFEYILDRCHYTLLAGSMPNRIEFVPGQHQIPLDEIYLGICEVLAFST